MVWAKKVTAKRMQRYFDLLCMNGLFKDFRKKSNFKSNLKNMKFNVERNTSENTENQFLHASQNFKHFNGKHFDPCAEKYVDPCAENMNNNPAYAYVGGANPAGARDGSSVAELQAEILEFKNLIRNGKTLDPWPIFIILGISKNTFRDVFASYRHIYSLSVELQNNHITQIPKLSLRDHTNFLSILALNKAPINAGNFLLYNLIDILETQDLGIIFYDQ